MNKVFQTAFTLIELLVVIAIIGILSGLIVVTMSGVTQKANIAKAQVFSNSLRNALMLNLVSEWKLDGNTNDSWGSNNGSWSGPAGTNTSATYLSSDCIFNQCLSFDGTDDCVTVANNTSLNITTSFTIEMWIKRTAVSSDRVDLLRRDSSESYAFYSPVGSTSVDVRFRDVSDVAHAGTYVIVPTGQWNHLVGTYDGTYLKFYLNGVLGPKDNIGSYTVRAGSGDLIIGRDDPVAGRYFNGLIDGVRVYGAAVPSSLVKENYYAGINSLFSRGSISQSEYLERINNIAINE